MAEDEKGWGGGRIAITGLQICFIPDSTTNTELDFFLLFDLSTRTTRKHCPSTGRKGDIVRTHRTGRDSTARTVPSWQVDASTDLICWIGCGILYLT